MPIAEDITMPKKESQEYPPLPKDIYQVELLEVEAKKQPTYNTRSKPQEEQVMENVLKFQFTIVQEGELRGRNIWENFVPAYLYIGKNGKNKLYRIVEAFIGRELKPEEEARGISSVTLNSFIGKQCRISVDPKTKGEKTFDNITDYYKAISMVAKLTDEEKDKARVKPKEVVEVKEVNEDEVDLSDIPF